MSNIVPIKKVLVVDDSELIQKMYRIMFNKYKGCTVITAQNGSEALDKLALDSGFDLIILDINMPVMNGVQFLENVNQQKKYSHIPVIIISTEDKERDTIKGLALGAKGYINKPFNAAMLHSLIDKIFNGVVASNVRKNNILEQASCLS